MNLSGWWAESVWPAIEGTQGFGKVQIFGVALVVGAIFVAAVMKVFHLRGALRLGLTGSFVGVLLFAPGVVVGPLLNLLDALVNAGLAVAGVGG